MNDPSSRRNPSPSLTFHLPHEFALQADRILLDGELRERGEMNGAGCAYQGIELADLTEHSAYGRGIVDIDLEIAGGSADSDQIMAHGEFGRHGFADHATRTNMNDSHEAPPLCALHAQRFKRTAKLRFLICGELSQWAANITCSVAAQLRRSKYRRRIGRPPDKEQRGQHPLPEG